MRLGPPTPSSAGTRRSRAARGGDAEALAKAWQGDYNHMGERDYRPGHAALFARGVDFDAGSGEARALMALADELARTLTPDLACDLVAEAAA